jgi:F-type H+-transporting ATPase subunit a
MNNRMLLAALILVGAAGLAFRALPAAASGSEHGAASGHGAAAEHGEHAKKAHGGGGVVDHWSYFSSIIPESAVNNFKQMLGLSWFGQEPVTRVMHVPMSAFAAILALLLGVAAGRRFRNVDEAIRPAEKPSMTGFVEVLLEGVYGIATQVMSEKYAKKAFPLLATLTLYILICNLFGCIPGLFPPTDNLNTTLSMAIVVFFATHYLGVQAHGPGYFKHFLGPIIHPLALPLMLLMAVIETIGHLARPVSLSIRLMGNMTADHKVLAIFIGFGILVAPLPIQVLGLIVALVQTMVFLLLSAVYIGLAVDVEEH